MMNKFSWTIIVCLCLFLFASYDSNQAQWRGEIEVKEGVKIIKNPQDPLYGEIKFELEEDLNISSEAV